MTKTRWPRRVGLCCCWCSLYQVTSWFSIWCRFCVFVWYSICNMLCCSFVAFPLAIRSFPPLSLPLWSSSILYTLFPSRFYSFQPVFAVKIFPYNIFSVKYIMYIGHIRLISPINSLMALFSSRSCIQNWCEGDVSSWNLFLSLLTIA